jgi:hypothetical protein
MISKTLLRQCRGDLLGDYRLEVEGRESYVGNQITGHRLETAHKGVTPESISGVYG